MSSLCLLEIDLLDIKRDVNFCSLSNVDLFPLPVLYWARQLVVLIK